MGLALPGGVLLAGLAVWALVAADSYDLRLLAVAGCYALLTLGYQFIFGHAGALSLAQGAFFGLGAYGSALMALHLGLPFWVTFPAGVAATVLAALIVSLPVIRLESHYLALATLGISQVALLVVIDWVSFTGGSNGLPGVPPPGLGIGPAGTVGYALFVWAWVALGAGLTLWLLRRRLGRALPLVREDPVAAAAAGIDVARVRLAAFLLSALFGGAAGALYVHGIAVAAPDTLEFREMVTVLCMAVIGGRRRILGAVLGAILLVHLPEWFRFLEEWALLAYGAGLLLIILLAPEGLAGVAGAVWARVLRPPPYVPTTTPPMPAPTRAAHLRIDAVSKQFGGNHALQSVSLELDAGITGVIGPNGSGKTTLLNCIGGQYRADSGRISLNGLEITGWPAWRRARGGLGRTFQQGGSLDGLPPLGRVAAALPEPEPDRARDLAAALLERTGAQADGPDLTNLRRVQVALAQALALNPSVVLLDEPAAGLTPAEQDDLAATLRALAAEGRRLLVADHNMRFLTALADRMICLDQGQVIAAGRPDDVMADPAVLTAYLGRRGAPTRDSRGGVP